MGLVGLSFEFELHSLSAPDYLWSLNAPNSN
jgi:hypothetical protein